MWTTCPPKPTWVAAGVNSSAEVGHRHRGRRQVARTPEGHIQGVDSQTAGIAADSPEQHTQGHRQARPRLLPAVEAELALEVEEAALAWPRPAVGVLPSAFAARWCPWTARWQNPKEREPVAAPRPIPRQGSRRQPRSTRAVCVR